MNVITSFRAAEMVAGSKKLPLIPTITLAIAHQRSAIANGGEEVYLMIDLTQCGRKGHSCKQKAAHPYPAFRGHRRLEAGSTCGESEAERKGNARKRL